MNIEAVRSVIRGNLEAVDQGLRFLSSLTDEQYICVTPLVKSSIAEHIRHVLDMYFAVIRRVDGNVIDYDVRRRGDVVESCRKQAQVELNEVRNWLSEFDLGLRNLSRHSERFNNPRLDIKTEVTLNETESVVVPTTEIRELVFIGSHAVHHYALIDVIARLQGIETEEKLGVAPATASFLREEPGCAQ